MWRKVVHKTILPQCGAMLFAMSRKVFIFVVASFGCQVTKLTSFQVKKFTAYLVKP